MKMSKRQYGLTALMFAFLCVAGYFAVNRYVVTSQLRDSTHQETANSVDDNQNASERSQSAPIHLISDEMVVACSGSEAKVLKAMQANRAKCPARAAVTWTLLNTRIAEDGTSKEYRGKFEQWWDGNRIATRNSLQMPGINPDGTTETTVHGYRTAFDGNEFRTTDNEPSPKGIETRPMPQYNHGESWLTLIHWEQGPDLARVRANPIAKVTWTEETRDGKPFAQRLALNTSDGAALVVLFDLERGGERVETTSRDPKGRTYATSSYRLEQVDGGAWFPVEIDQQSFTPDTGKIQNRNQYQITRSDSAFGAQAQIDEGVFELPPWKDLIAKPGADSNSKDIPLDKLDSAPARECRALIKRLDDDGEVQLAAVARERLAKRWKGITQQPAASFARQPTAKDPDVSRAYVQIQTELDGVWSNSKGTVEDWTDRIIGKQADYRTDRLKLLFEAAQGYGKSDDAKSAARVLRTGLNGHAIYDKELSTLIEMYWPVTNDEPAKSLGSAAHLGTLVNFLRELSATQQALGELDDAVETQSRLMLASFMLSWNQPSGEPTKSARDLWSLIRQQRDPKSPLFWFNVVHAENPEHQFDLAGAGQKGNPLTYHHENLVAQPSLNFNELTITATTHGRKGILDCRRINSKGQFESVGVLTPSADGEADQMLTQTFKVPAETGMVQFMVAGEDFRVGEMKVKATFTKRDAAVKPATDNPGTTSPYATTSQLDSVQANKSGPVSDQVRAKLEALFQKHYPKATFANRGVEGIHVEHEVATFEFPSTRGKGAKREAEKQQGPKKGGILCSVYSHPGRYLGQLQLSPVREGQVAQHLIDRKEYKQLLMAPYSQKSDVHMWVALSYPPDTDEEFLKKLREIMADFEKAAE